MTPISRTDLIIYHGLLDFKADLQIFALDQHFQGLEENPNLERRPWKIKNDKQRDNPHQIPPNSIVIKNKTI